MNIVIGKRKDTFAIVLAYLPSLYNDFLFRSDISRSTKPQTAKNNGNFACSTNGRVGKGFPCKGHVFNLLSPTGFWCVRTKHKRNMGLTTISLLKLHLVCHHPFLGNLRFWTNKLFLFNVVPPKKGGPKVAKQNLLFFQLFFCLEQRVLCIFFISLTNGLSYFWCVTRSNRKEKGGLSPWPPASHESTVKSWPVRGHTLGSFMHWICTITPLGYRANWQSWNVFLQITQ